MTHPGTLSERAGSVRNVFVWNGLNKVLRVVLRPLWRLLYHKNSLSSFATFFFRVNFENEDCSSVPLKRSLKIVTDGERGFFFWGGGEEGMRSCTPTYF